MKITASSQDYMRVFQQERSSRYPAVDAFERTVGFSMDVEILERLALPLACPVKKNPPNWQHGRVIYSAVRNYLASGIGWANTHPLFVDIGTAKGFSALVMAHAISDAGRAQTADVISVDLLEPEQRVTRNSISECDGLKTIAELTDHLLPSGMKVQFLGGGSESLIGWLPEKVRIAFAFVDGKHSYEAVRRESVFIASRQRQGDQILFDDIQIAEVAAAARSTVEESYTDAMEIPVGKARRYLLAVRK